MQVHQSLANQEAQTQPVGLQRGLHLPRERQEIYLHHVCVHINHELPESIHLILCEANQKYSLQFTTALVATRTGKVGLTHFFWVK